MEMTTLSFNEEGLMRLEAIFMNQDKEEALRFLLEVMKPKRRSKGNPSPGFEERDWHTEMKFGKLFYQLFSKKGGESHGRDSH